SAVRIGGFDPIHHDDRTLGEGAGAVADGGRRVGVDVAEAPSAFEVFVAGADETGLDVNPVPIGVGVGYRGVTGDMADGLSRQHEGEEPGNHRDTVAGARTRQVGHGELLQRYPGRRLGSPAVGKLLSIVADIRGRLPTRSSPLAPSAQE